MVRVVPFIRLLSVISKLIDALDTGFDCPTGLIELNKSIGPAIKNRIMDIKQPPIQIFFHGGTLAPSGFVM